MQVVTDKPTTLGEQVRRRRLELHLHQTAVARQLGVHLGTIRNWEQGVYQPDKNLLPRIMAWLGYDPRKP